jgi:hypothetical protein
VYLPIPRRAISGYALRMRKLLCIFLVSLSLTLPLSAAAKKKNQFSMQKIPDQWVELAHVADVVAEQPCGNWAWAAAMESILRRQKVELDQRFWILKLNGGLPCLPSAGTLENLKRQIDGEYVLADHRHVRIEINYRESLPETTDALLLPMAHGRPYMIWWKGQTFLVKGATWDELIYQTGQKLVEIKTLKLINPLEQGEKRKVIFDRMTDDTNDLSATFDAVVTELDFNPWEGPRNRATEPIVNPAIDK